MPARRSCQDRSCQDRSTERGSKRLLPIAQKQPHWRRILRWRGPACGASGRVGDARSNPLRAGNRRLRARDRTLRPIRRRVGLRQSPRVARLDRAAPAAPSSPYPVRVLSRSGSAAAGNSATVAPRSAAARAAAAPAPLTPGRVVGLALRLVCEGSARQSAGSRRPDRADAFTVKMAAANPSF